jgi:hypothetical protein
MANWEYVLGVNLFNNHGYHYSIEGERKRDWPPSQFYHHPWWDHYPEFTNYMARLSHLLTGGHHVAKLLVLYPIASIWTNFMPQEHDAVSKVIERDFNHLTDALLRLHHDFDYVDEDVLAEATVDGGKIKIRDEEFEVLILPPVTHIKPSTFARIKELVDGGGSVIATTLLPVHFIEAGNAAPVPTNGETADFAGFFGHDPAALLERFIDDDPVPFEIHHRTGAGGRGNIFVITGPGLGTDAEPITTEAKAALDEAVKKCITPDVTISDPDVFYLHRVNSDLDLYFFANTTQEDRGRVEVTFERVGRPELWDARTGEITPLAVYDLRDGRLVVSLDFPPSESRVVVIREGEDERHVTETNLTDVAIDAGAVAGFADGGEDAFAEVSANGSTSRLSAAGRSRLRPITLPSRATFSLEHDNALLIGTFKMRSIEDEGVAPDGFEQPDFDDSAWLDVTNGAWEMQLPMERDEAVYPVTVQYRTAFEVRGLPEDPRIMIDGFRGSSYRLFLNGHEITDRGQRSKLDAEIREVDVRPYLREGRNVVALEIVATKRTDGLLDLIKVVGDFALEQVGDEYAIIGRPTEIGIGTWTKQGYPFFSGTGVYRFEADVPEDYLGGRLLLEADLGEDVLAVSVNGAEAQVAPWHPYRLDITEHVRAGKNSFELKVTNTLLNVLEGKPLESGLFSPPRLMHQHRYVLEHEQPN